MMGFSPSLGLGTIYGDSSSSKEFNFVFSVFAGIIMCKLAYEFTRVLSFLFFKGYTNLSSAQKVEWNNRGFSTFHALFVAVASLYFVLVSNIFDEDGQEGLLINRTSPSINTVFGMSIGYFLTDLAMILWTYPALGGMEYVFHHGLSMFSILQSFLIGQGQFYILMVLFTEVTTPFVNLRWYLDVAGKKDSKLYIYNGIALFFGWLVSRIFLFVYFFNHMFLHFDQVKVVYTPGYYSLLTVPPVLAMMNLFWFYKIAKGMVKTLSKSKMRRHSHTS